MQLSNLEQNGTLVLAVEGQTKTVTMLTNTSAVPYNAYYDMPSGYATWLSIVVSGNLFTITAQGNLFGGEARSKVVRFWCQDSYSSTPASLSVTVTQAADTVAVTFDPTSASLAYTEGDSDTITLAGVPVGAVMTVEAPEWITASVLSESSMSVSAAANMSDAARVGGVILTVDGRPFYFEVTQAACTLALTFDPTSVSFGAGTDLSEVVDVTGIPVGASVNVQSPSWIASAVGTGTITLTAQTNADTVARSGTVVVTVYGLEFSVPVSQAANSYPSGKLTLSASSNTFSFTGGTLTVSATEMPTGITEMTVEAVKGQGYCADCGNSGSFVSWTKISDISYKLTVEAQDIFDGIERAFLLKFVAGTESVQFTVTQSAPPVVYRFGASGDKFLKRAVSLQEPTYLVESTVLRMYDSLKTNGWTALDSQVSPLLVGAERDNVPTLGTSLEAFKACYNHVTVAGTTYHNCAMGAAVYRFAFNPEAYGLVIRGLRVKTKGDAYNVNGVRVAVETGNTTDTPSEDWLVIREGSAGKNIKGSAARYLKASDGLYYGGSGTLIFDGLDITVSASTRIYLYITMEDYRGITNGWVYGSGILAPSFDFYADDLISGLEDGDWIAEATAPEGPDQIVAGEVSLVSQGMVNSPKAPLQADCEKREIVVREFLLGNGIKEPSTQIATAGLAALFAMTAKNGLSSVSMNDKPLTPWQQEQLGLAAYVCRHVGDIASPFKHVLRYVISPLTVLAALPIGALAKNMRLTHRTGLAALSAAGADVRVSVYWFAAQTLETSDIDALAAIPAFSAGGSQLSAGGKTGNLRGTSPLASSMTAGSSLTIPIGSLSDRWGTFLIVPWIARVTSEVTLGSFAGLVGPQVDDNVTQGGGWLPDIVLEV